MKLCSKCGQAKPIAEFGRNRSRKDGRQSYCRACRAAYAETNKAKVVAYRKVNKDKIAAQRRTYREANKTRLAEKERAWRVANGAKRAELARVQRERYPRKASARRAVSHAVRDGKLTKPDRCEDCGSQTKPHLLHGHHADYGKPLEVEWLCGDCHRERHRSDDVVAPEAGGMSHVRRFGRLIPKQKAPAWLTTAFAEGVLELAPPRPVPAYKGALGRCWLAQHDPQRRPCVGPFERFHFISRQRVESATADLLTGAMMRCPICHSRSGGECEGCFGAGRARVPFIEDLILLAAWDPRNGDLGCEGHHRRYDSHLTPTLKLHAATLPDHTVDFIFDWGLESEAERRFDNFIRY